MTAKPPYIAWLFPGKAPLWVAYTAGIITSAALLVMHLRGGDSFASLPLTLSLDLFLIPALLSSYLGGLLPGLTSTAIVSVLTLHFLVLPRQASPTGDPAAVEEWISLLVLGVIFSVMSEQLHRSRRRAEASERLRAITLETISDAVVVTDQQGRINFLNPKAEQLTGWSMGEALGEPAAKVLPIRGEPRQALPEDPVEEVLRTGSPGRPLEEITLLTRQGAQRPIEGRVAPIRSVEGVEGAALIFKDLEELRRAEAALEENQRFLRTLIGNLPGMVYRCRNDREWTMEFLSEGCEALTGYQPQEIVGNAAVSYSELIHPDDKERVWKEVQQALAQRLPFHLTYRIRTAGGTVKWVWEHGQGVFAPAGGLLALEGVVNDISERIRSQEKLREREELLAEISRIAKIGAWQFDVPTLEGSWTEEVARIHEMEPEVPTSALIGLSFYHGESRQKIEAAVKLAIERGEPYDLELEMVTAQGNHKWVRTIGVPVTQGDRVVQVRGTLQDITTKKRNEQWRALETEILGLVSSGMPLPELLEKTTLAIDAALPGLRSSILLVDETGGRLHHGAAPHLPPDYNEAINGLPIGPQSGSCGTAAYRRQPVIISDISADPLWDDFRELASQHGLRACWSEPVLSADGKVVATFALYFGEPKSPTPDERHLMFRLARLVGLAIERTRSLDEIKQSQQRLSEVYEHVADVIFYLRIEPGGRYRFLSVNPAFYRVTGLDEKQVDGKLVEEVIPESSWTQALNKYRQAIETRQTVRWEETSQYPNGPLTGVVTVTPVFDASQQPLYLIGSVHDITERKRAEDRLRRSESILADSQKLTHTGSWSWNLSTNELFWSDEAYRIFGFDPATTHADVQKTFLRRIHPDDRARIEQGIREAQRVKDPFETDYRIVLPDGRVRDIHELVLPKLNPAGEVVERYGLAIDVTDRKQAEVVLREKAALQEQLSRIVAAAPGVIFSYRLRPDGSSYFPFTSARLREMFGLRSEELLEDAAPGFAQVHRDDLEPLQQAILKSARDLSPLQREFRLLHKTKGLIWGSATAIPTREADGGVLWHGVLTDVTERKRAEEVLQEKASLQEQLSSLVTTVPGVVYSLLRKSDGSMSFPFASLRLQELFPVSPEQLALDASPALALIHGDDREQFQSSIAMSFEQLAPWRQEFRIQHPVRGVIWAEGNALPVRLPDGSILWHGFLTDITERKQLESQFLQAQKMEAVGRLAGGVAHDFNNLLGVILGYADMMMEGMAPEDANRRRLDLIKKSAQNGVSLTRQLLAFSRKGVQQPRLLDLNAVVQEEEMLLKRLLGEDIQMALRYGSPLGKVRADPGQLQQVLMNLAVNARDAMPKGGTLTIETREVDLDPNYARTHTPAVPGRYVMLAVSDTGEGMTKEVQARLFEPFFTTKEKGKGTGLGMAMVYGVVKQSGGFIWVYSEPGKGATFKIYLPLAEPSVEDRQLRAAIPSSIRGSSTILIAEDEDALRQLACEILQGAGYRVLKASNGKEALQTIEHSKEPIHLLLTDVIMPGMSGSDLAARALALRPSLKVIYMSGYTDDAIAHHGVLAPGVLLVEKPFTKDSLLRKVSELFPAEGSQSPPPLH